MLFKQNNTERKTKYFVVLLAIIIKILKYIYCLFILSVDDEFENYKFSKYFNTIIHYCVHCVMFNIILNDFIRAKNKYIVQKNVQKEKKPRKIPYKIHILL